MSYEDDMRRIIDSIASKGEMESSHLTQEEYCRIHPEDPVCKSYDEQYPKRQMYQPPDEQDDQDEQGERDEQEVPPKPPVVPPKPPVVPPKPPPSIPPKPPYKPPSVPPKLPPPFYPPEYKVTTDEYRGVRGGLDMYSKDCPVCSAVLPAGTNFCPRCGTIVEALERGRGGKGAGKGGPS